ncbi:MAG: hypothetical protein AAB691_00030 [Patescibacteria group bacterium]
MADQSYEGYAPSHMGCFGGYGAKPGVLEVLVRPAKIIGSVLILTILILALVVRTLYAGCNIIPSASPKDRRDDLCLSQGKQPGCTLKGDIEIGGEIRSRETDFDLVVGGIEIGTFPFPQPSEPAPPGTCSNKELVKERLLYYPGPPGIQQILRDILRDVKGRDAIYFADILGTPEELPGLCVIQAVFAVKR